MFKKIAKRLKRAIEEARAEVDKKQEPAIGEDDTAKAMEQLFVDREEVLLGYPSVAIALMDDYGRVILIADDYRQVVEFVENTDPLSLLHDHNYISGEIPEA